MPLRVGVIGQARCYERSLHTAGADGVESHARMRMIESERFGQAHDPELRDGVCQTVPNHDNTADGG